MQVILLLLDGLSFSFTRSHPNITAAELARDPLFNKIDAIENMEKKHPGGTVHKKSIVTPPTWTLQRLQSILSGGQTVTAYRDLVFGLCDKDTFLDHVKGRNHLVGDIIWQRFLECNPRINITGQYVNYFITEEGKDHDQMTFDMGQEVRSYNPVCGEQKTV